MVLGQVELSTREDRLHRGRKVGLAFLMQGWGQLLNQGLLCIFLIIFHNGDGEPPYSAVAVQWTYRVVFAIPAVGTLWLVYYTTYKMPAASKQLVANKRKNKVTGYGNQSLRLAIRYFGPRLFALVLLGSQMMFSFMVTSFSKLNSLLLLLEERQL